MKLNLTVTDGIEIGHEQKTKKVMKVIADRKQARADLLKRAAELKVRADACHRTDPKKARSLEHRSIVLQNEEYRMRKESEHGMTYEQIRKSALCGKCALLLDEMKYKQG